MKFLKCRDCGKESDIEQIPICQCYICPDCAKKTDLMEERLRWGYGACNMRQDGSIYKEYDD